MTLPNSFTFTTQNAQYLNWTLTDPLTGNFINDAAVTATLYMDRSLSDPDDFPGTAVANFSALNLPFVSNGLYRGIIPNTFDTPTGGNYVLVVDATSPSYDPQHWETPSVVVVRGA